MTTPGRSRMHRISPVTDDLVWCDTCDDYHLPNQHAGRSRSETPCPCSQHHERDGEPCTCACLVHEVLRAGDASQPRCEEVMQTSGQT